MIRVIVLGKIKEKYLEDAINDYLKRINKYHKTEIIELKDDIDISKEEKAVMKYMNNHDYNIVLDIDSSLVTSEDIAKIISNKLMEYGNINFIVGSSNGLSDAIKKSANLRISFGRITMPHGLFRVLLLEQIYRGFKINNNESYHK